MPKSRKRAAPPRERVRDLSRRREDRRGLDEVALRRNLLAHAQRQRSTFFLERVAGFTRQRAFAKNKSARADARAEWAWNSITGRAKQPVGIGFYPTNMQGETRWGAFDFDAHGNDTEEAEKTQQRALAAFHLLSRHTQLRLLLGTSGSHGWHLFCYSDRFLPVSEWIGLLEDVARKIGVPVQDGVCEIFPSSTRGRIGGGGIRAPGSFNPKTGQCGRIYFDQVGPALIEPVKEKQSSEEKSYLFSVSVSYEGRKTSGHREKTISSQIKDKSEPISELESRFHIDAARTRRARLKRLVGESFRCYGRDLLRQAAERQHKLAAVAPVASLSEHMAEFDGFFDFFHDLWIEELSQPEREKFARLTIQTERDFFRIVHGWNKLKGEDSDFKLSTGNIALRLGIGVSYATKIRKKFWKELGIIDETVPFVANVTPARFKWIIANKPANQMKGTTHK